MPGNRKAAEEFILGLVKDIDPSGINNELYVEKFANMTDEEFDGMIKGLEEGTTNLVMVAPNFSKVQLDVQRNFDVAEKYGVEFFKRIWMPEADGLPAYLTPIPYLVIRLPVRRQAQLLEKKISIPDGTDVVDSLTNQVTGSSKGSKISYPETHLLAAAGLDNTLIELLKVRGGDSGAFNAYSALISRSGEASLKTVNQYATGVEAKAALSVFLRGMMLNNTL